ncbi:YfhO family protein [Actinoplanes sp. NPDC051513]|uniref:YfhO family protein n=1 Tax=Actinoplanes sp. NPDC051513 TaxID=3363908 RepID=UPI00379B4C05
MSAASPTRRWWDREWVAAVGAAVLAMGAFCLSLRLGHTYPFGPTSRAVNDLGNQFIPFHAELWDLEHGVMNGDLYFSWSSGYGSAFLPDVFSFLGNPFSWLVGLFPRTMLDLPVFLVTLLSLGLAAAVMTVFLGRLQAGSRWLRMLLGVGYGMCGWVINDAFADPMWLWGLAGLPLICIAADWCLQGRRWVLGTLVVAVVWVGNFYTAAMATLAAVLILLVRLLLDDRPWGARLRVLPRAASMMLVGVLLAAPVLTVSGLASRYAQTLGPGGGYRDPPAIELAARFLPAGQSVVAAPNIAIGLLGLLLVAAFPFHRAISVRERLVWSCLLALVLASLLWRPTILLWHGLAMPNGSPYRASFVFCGMLTMVAWLSLARRPGPGALLAGGAVVVALLVITRNTTAVRPSVWQTVLIGVPVAVGALLVVQRVRVRWLRAAAFAVLTVGVFLTSTYSSYVTDQVRGAQAFFDPHPTMMQASTRAAFQAIQRARTWPEARVETGPHRFANNDPALLRAEGSRYYDTYVSAVAADAMRSLGVSFTWSGRHIHSPTDPVTRALMGVSAFLNPDLQLEPAGPAAPLVTVHPAAQPPTSSVFARQEALLGATVYQVPALRFDDGPAPVSTDGGWQIPPTPQGSKWTSFTAGCTPGAEIYFYARWFAGRVHTQQQTFPSAAVEPITGNPMTYLGTVPPDGKIRISLAVGRPQLLPSQALGCLDRGKLTAAIDRLRATGATHVETGGHTITATLPPGSTGVAVMAIPATEGWTCAGRAPISYYGFIGVPLDGAGTRVHCSFEPPGLRAGLAGTGVALIIVLAVAVVGRVRARRVTGPHAPRLGCGFSA